MNKELELFSFYYGYPCSNITWEEYENSEYIILGHFTTSVFLDSILLDGLDAPINTNKFSNKDMFMDGDEYYIYLTGHFDSLFAENAVKKFGGKKILLLVKVRKKTLELDDLRNIYTNQGIDLTCQRTIYEVLHKNIMCQCRTKVKILSEQIIEILDVDKIFSERLTINEKSYLNRRYLTFSELKKNVNIELLRFQPISPPLH